MHGYHDVHFEVQFHGRKKSFTASCCRKAAGCALGWSLFQNFEKLYGNRVKFVRFRQKTVHAKYVGEKLKFRGCTRTAKICDYSYATVYTISSVRRILKRGGGYFERVRSVQTTLTRIRRFVRNLR